MTIKYKRKTSILLCSIIAGVTFLLSCGFFLDASGEEEYTDWELRMFREWGIRKDDNDLLDLIKKVNKIRIFAERCEVIKCPEIDCKKGLEILQHLEKAGSMLDDMNTAMVKLNTISLNHWTGLVAEAKIAGENLVSAQNALAIQEYLHGFGTNLLDIADIKDFCKNFRKDPKKLISLKAEDIVNNAWKIHKLALNIESLVSSINNSISGNKLPKPISGLTPDAFGITGSDINLLKGIAGEILGAMTSFKSFEEFQDAKGKGTWRNALKKPDQWKAALTEPGGPRTNLLSLIGTFFSKWSQSEIQKRKEFIASLNREITATDIVKSNSYMTLARVQARRYLVEDAMKAVDKARETLYSCLMKAKCPTLDNRGIPIRTWNFTINTETGLYDTLGNLLLELDVRRHHLGSALPELKECKDQRETGIKIRKDDTANREVDPNSYRYKAIQSWAGVWKTTVGFIRINQSMKMELIYRENLEGRFKKEQLGNVNTTWARYGFKLRVEGVTPTVISGQYTSDYEKGTFMWKMVSFNLKNNIYYSKQFTGYRIQKGKTRKTRFRGFLLRQKVQKGDKI